MAPANDPSLDLDIVVSVRAWHRQVKGLTAYVRAIAAAAYEAGLHDGAAPFQGPVALAFSNDTAVQALNAQFRGKDKPTNVLSFPAPRGQGGDIILAYETVASEAENQGKPMPDHTAHLVAHGILHLMGYDHMERGPARHMERLERRILDGFGIADPYSIERLKPEP